MESDVDVLVLARDASWEGKERSHDTLSRAASDLDLRSLPWDFSVHVHTPGRSLSVRLARPGYPAASDTGFPSGSAT